MERTATTSLATKLAGFPAPQERAAISVGDRPGPPGTLLPGLFRSPPAQLRKCLLCPSLLFFSVGLDSPVVGYYHGERKQDEAEEACEEVHNNYA